MSTTEKKAATKFEKVGECLYRYQPNGIYYARLKREGKQIWESLKTTDKAFASRKLREKKNELENVNPSAGKITVEELCARYLKTILHQKPKTIEAKKNVVSRMGAKGDWPQFKTQQVKDVKPSDVQTFLSLQGKRISKASYNQYVQVVRDIFKLAHDDRLIATSPAAGIKLVKRDKPIRLTPSVGQFQQIVESIRTQKFADTAEDSADFLEFMGLAGLGQAEVSSLKWGEINFERREITTFRHKTSQGFMIPIYPQLLPLLERLKGKHKFPPDELVFKVKDVKKSLEAACKRLGFPAYSQRSFRRLFITRALEKGVDVKVIAEWQGHKDGGKLILDTYSHVNRTHAKKMADLMVTDESEQTA